MSNAITNICRELWRIPRTKKVVLLCLADRADPEGTCWPGIETICTHTGLRRTAVLEAVKWLEVNWYVKVERKSGRGNVYHLDIARLRLEQTSQGSKPVREPVRRVDLASSAHEPVPVREADSTSAPAGPEANITELKQPETPPSPDVPGSPELWAQVQAVPRYAAILIPLRAQAATMYPGMEWETNEALKILLDDGDWNRLPESKFLGSRRCKFAHARALRMAAAASGASPPNGGRLW